MFSVLLQRVEDRCLVLENFLRLCAAYDEAASSPPSVLFRELESRGVAQINIKEDHVFRHCAVMTQLYGLYESFAEAILAAWLVRVPRYYALADLPDGFQNAYRYGVSRIIQNVDKRRYQHLSLQDVLEKYFAAVRGASPWEFINEALTSHDANLRQAEFVQMFSQVGLTNVWQSLERNDYIKIFKAETGSDKSLENLILDLVTFRNEASHGTPDEILGADTLREWIAFVRAFCSALADVILHHIVNAEVSNQPLSVIGIVTETFKNNIVVARCDRGSLRVGETIYFLRSSDCVSATIESLQLDDVSQPEVHIDRLGLEVGVRTSIRVHRNARLVRLEDTRFNTPTEVTPRAPRPEESFISRVSSFLDTVKERLKWW